MSKIIKELIEYNISTSCNRDNLINFKQFSIDNIICIPIEKPDIEHITKVWVNYEICDYEIINTPKGVSNEGQVLTGYKLFLSANLKVKFEYVCSEMNNSVHSSTALVPICAYITLPEKFNDNSDVLPSIAIEDVYCEQINTRDIYINTILIAIVDIC